MGFPCLECGQNFPNPLKLRGHVSASHTPVTVPSHTPDPAPPEETPAASCSGCGAHGKLSTCSRCHAAAYCSRTCQSQHWKVHKRACNSQKLVPTPSIAQHSTPYSSTLLPPGSGRPWDSLSHEERFQVFNALVERVQPFNQLQICWELTQTARDEQLVAGE